ncbi:helix-turn-helix domain-containing protein [Mucilaginibacter lappiensis]|uniref:helix-turn-helix domain-containing protein n=1 Tax=Mucilaginibacter lappiensis TaxID=354630 RepID=UPI003D1A8756
MLTSKEQQTIKELRLKIKLKWLEQIMKQFFTESLEAVLFKNQSQIVEIKSIFTIADICKKFQVSKATIHNWINRGIIKGAKVGKNRYFTDDEINNILKYIS